MATDTNDDHGLEQLLIRWKEARDRGETLTPELLCAKCPELAEKLRRQIQVLLDWNGMGAASLAMSNATEEQALCCEPAPATAWVESRYRDLNFHDRGGLGVVFTAQHEGLSRQVALKFIRRDRREDPLYLRRFLREAQITARLEHPGIVPIYGIGQDEDGHPCHALRFVQGATLEQAIKAYHDGRAASCDREPMEKDRACRTLLQVFRAACTTVAYAHSRGVLHRDLKPANIMLGPFDETLVVDWGLAKVSGDESATSDDQGQEALLSIPVSEVIETRGVIGTPGFMSPEQHAGRWDEVGPASDIYSLGATLYMVLTSQSPFRRCPLPEMATSVQEGKFTAPREVNSSVPRALEAVCLKAMALKPENRYPTVLDMAADLESWLAGEPVTAWQEPWPMRARRWLARRRTLVWGLRAASFLVLLAVGAVIGLVIWSNYELSAKNRQLIAANRQTEAARDHAERRLSLAQQAIQQFQQAVSDNLDVKGRPDLKPLRTTLLQAPLKFYAELRHELEEAQETQPEAKVKLATAIEGLAQITALLDSQAGAARAYQEAIQIVTPMVYDHLALPDSKAVLASTLSNLAYVQLMTGQQSLALSNQQEALKLCESLAQDYPGEERFRFSLAEVLNQLGVMLRGNDQMEEAEGTLERSGGILAELLLRHPLEERYKAQLALVSNNLGVLYRVTHRLKEAQEQYQKALQVQRALYRDHRGDVKYRSGLANSCYNLGNVYIDLNQAQNALRSFDEAVGVLEDLVREQPAVPAYRASLAKFVGNTATLLGFQGRPEEARPRLERARDLLVQLVSEHRDVLRFREDLALTYYHLGHAQKNTGQPANALGSFEQARDLFESLARSNPNDLKSLNMLGTTYHLLGFLGARLHGDAESLDALKRSIPRLKEASTRAPDDFRSELAEAYHDLLVGLFRTGKHAEMKHYMEEAFQAFHENHPGTNETYTLACLYSLKSAAIIAQGPGSSAELQALSDRYAELAVELLRRAPRNSEDGMPMIQRDPLLDAIRTRSDFRLLLLDLGFPAQPFRP
jgi:serine/threonine-protein kinase